MAFLNAIEGAVAQGILWGLMTLGVYLTFRILNVADMTVDGSFAAGGAVSAVLIVNGFNPVFSLLVSFALGTVCGLCTGFMNTKLKINILLASILSQLALYSVNIRIMGRPNTPLLGSSTMMKDLIWLFKKIFNKNLSSTVSSLIIGIIVIVVVVAILYWFLGTEYGSAIRATGSNENMVRAMGVNTDTTKIIGLMISNGMVAMSGALVAQSQGFADVQMGTGAIVIGLASIIIGEVIFGSHFGFWYTLVSVVLGSVIYRIVIAVVLQLGLKSSDLKLFTALIVAVSLSVPVFKQGIDKRRKAYKGPYNEKNTRRSDDKFKHGIEG